MVEMVDLGGVDCSDGGGGLVGVVGGWGVGRRVEERWGGGMRKMWVRIWRGVRSHGWSIKNKFSARCFISSLIRNVTPEALSCLAWTSLCSQQDYIKTKTTRPPLSSHFSQPTPRCETFVTPERRMYPQPPLPNKLRLQEDRSTQVGNPHPLKWV